MKHFILFLVVVATNFSLRAQTTAGNPKIEFLGRNGTVIYSLPEKGENGL